MPSRTLLRPVRFSHATTSSTSFTPDSLLGRAGQRRLAERVLPALRRPHVRVAEPELPVERGAGAHAFHPELGRDDCCIAEQTDSLRARFFVLLFVRDALLRRLVEQ